MQSLMVTATAPGTVVGIVSLPKDISLEEAKKLLQAALNKFVFFKESCTADESCVILFDKSDIQSIIKTNDIQSLIENLSKTFGCPTGSITWAQRFFEAYNRGNTEIEELLIYIKTFIDTTPEVRQYLERYGLGWLAGVAGIR